MLKLDEEKVYRCHRKPISTKDFAGFVEIEQGTYGLQNMPTHRTWEKCCSSSP